MAGQPIATVGSMTVCPLCSGTVPHVGGPIAGPGMPGVTINGQAVAVMGDICTCVGPPATIVQGCPGITINGTPVAMVGSMTSHGGQVMAGVPGVTIGASVPDTTVTMPLKKIPFPKINVLDDIGAAVVGKAKSHKEGKENIEKLKNDEEGDPKIYNLQWVKEDMFVRGSKVTKEVTLRASVLNIPDGQSVTFKVSRSAVTAGDENTEASNESVVELTGTVQDKMVEVVWEVEDVTQE